MCWWLETRAGAVASRTSWLCWDFCSLKAWKLISQCQHGQLIFNNWPTWVRTFFFASFSSVRRVGLMCPTSFKIQLTFIYVCLCLHNINFHQMMWTTYREPVIDINLLRFLFFAFNSCKQRVKEKKDFKWFHDRVDLLTVFFLLLFASPWLWKIVLRTRAGKRQIMIKNTRPGFDYCTLKFLEFFCGVRVAIFKINAEMIFNLKIKKIGYFLMSMSW